MTFFRNFLVFAVIGLVTVAVAYGIGLWRLAPDRSVVDFLDIGQGDAIVVRQGKTEVLIDGGPDRSVLSQLGRVMPFSDRKIELVVATHPHDDHIVGLLDVFGRYGIGELVIPRALSGESAYRPLLERAERFGVPVRTVTSGDRFILGNAALTVLWPGDDCLDRLAGLEFESGEHDPVNVCSLVFRYDHCDGNGCRRALLMADATGISEALMLEDGTLPSADLLKIGHHGSRFATTAPFLEIVRPKDAIIQVGEKNTFGHPGHGVLLRLRHVGAEIWRNDRNGPIRAVPEGKGFGVEER
ncbi:MBL fold metallo-hydrolase [Candidatus Uhrbacteria bacterium]|nr:MBL fold metallo-hydrolase [Candidatus Uhrbacteria bacterium]